MMPSANIVPALGPPTPETPNSIGNGVNRGHKCRKYGPAGQVRFEFAIRMVGADTAVPLARRSRFSEGVTHYYMAGIKKNQVSH